MAAPEVTLVRSAKLAGKQPASFVIGFLLLMPFFAGTRPALAQSSKESNLAFFRAQLLLWDKPQRMVCAGR